MLTGDDLEELRRRELAARGIRPAEAAERHMIDAWFTLLAQPAAIWLGMVRDAHAATRAQVYAMRRECERKNGPEP